MKLDLLKFFTREEQIAGLEVSDSFLRLVLLEQKEVRKKEAKKGEAKKEIVIAVKASGEKPLPQGAVANGFIADEKVFADALSGLLKEISKGKKTAVRYAMVSLPPNAVYARVFSYPKAITEDKVEESIKLTVGFSLPVKTDEVYLDWEKIAGGSSCLLAAVPKPVVDRYAAALRRAGLSPVAMEFHALSLARIFAADEPILLLVGSPSGVNFSVTEGGAVLFNRFVPRERLKSAAAEARKIIDFQSAGGRTIKKTFLAGEGLNPAEFEGVAEAAAAAVPGGLASLAKNADWLTALGAALRGLLPRSDDNLISLLPVGTEEAYEYQKALAFSEFVSGAAIGVSVFFAAAFLGVWFLMMTIQKNLNSQVGRLETLPFPPEDIQLEERAAKLNELTAPLAAFVRQAPRWSVFLKEFRSKLSPGVILNSLSIASPADLVGVTGVAATRDELNNFKRTLENWPAAAGVSVPLSNLELKQNIGFSASFFLSDPSFLYDVE